MDLISAFHDFNLAEEYENSCYNFNKSGKDRKPIFDAWLNNQDIINEYFNRYYPKTFARECFEIGICYNLVLAYRMFFLLKPFDYMKIPVTDDFYSVYRRKNILIQEPREPLKTIQSELQDLLHIKAHACAHAHVRGKSHLSHAALHTGKELVLTMKINEIYRSITWEMVKEHFYKDISQYLSERASHIALALCIYQLGLPLGGAATPGIINSVLYNFDEQMFDFFKQKDINYSRYNDNLAFSGNTFQRDEIIEIVSNKLLELNMSIDSSQVRFMRSTQRQTVCGLTVNKKLSISLKERKRIRAMQHRIRNGQIAFKKHTNQLRNKDLRGYNALSRSIQNINKTLGL